MKHLKNILSQYKSKLILIYFYMLVAESLLIIEPFILGKSIDGLILGSFNWIIFLFILFIFSNIFMYKRMVYDTKVYTKIYNEIVLKFVNNKKISNSAKIARTDMANQLIDFIEHYAHFYISTLITVVGSLYFIFHQNYYVGFTVLACIPFLSLIVIKFYKKIKQATVVGHDHYEQKVDIINKENTIEIDTFFKRRRKLLIMSSNLQGKNWILINSTKSLFLVLGLVFLSKTSINLTEGELISSYAYINNFLIALISIPIGAESFSRIKDVIKRINPNDE